MAILPVYDGKAGYKRAYERMILETAPASQIQRSISAPGATLVGRLRPSTDEAPLNTYLDRCARFQNPQRATPEVAANSQPGPEAGHCVRNGKWRALGQSNISSQWRRPRPSPATSRPFARDMTLQTVASTSNRVISVPLLRSQIRIVLPQEPEARRPCFDPGAF